MRRKKTKSDTPVKPGQIWLPMGDVWKFMLHKHLCGGKGFPYRASLRKMGSAIYLVLDVGSGGNGDTDQVEQPAE